MNLNKRFAPAIYCDDEPADGITIVKNYLYNCANFEEEEDFSFIFLADGSVNVSYGSASQIVNLNQLHNLPYSRQSDIFVLPKSPDSRNNEYDIIIKLGTERNASVIHLMQPSIENSEMDDFNSDCKTYVRKQIKSISITQR